MVTVHPPSSWSNPPMCVDHAQPPGSEGCHHPQLSAPFPCQFQCTSCSAHSSCSLTSRNTAALGLRSHHPEHRAHGQLCPVPWCWPALGHRHWFGVGAPAPILGRGTWCQFPSPAVGEPCFAQALLPPQAPHTPQLCYPRWEESAAINAGARLCCLVSACTQVWGNHSVQSSGWQTWGKVSVLGNIFLPMACSSHCTQDCGCKATISQQGQQSPEHAKPSLVVCPCPWLGGCLCWEREETNTTWSVERAVGSLRV